MPFEDIEKNIFQFLVLSQFKTYHPSGNLKLNNLGIFQSLKFHNLMEKKTFQILLS